MENLVQGIRSPVSLRYHHQPGRATGRFLRALKEGRIVGERCPSCRSVIVPPRGACARCGTATEEEVQLSDRGTVTTFCVVHLPIPGSEIKPPFVCATIRLDGADLGFSHLVSECKTAEVRPGLRVQAVWRPREEWGFTLENIRYFKPSGEPDVEVPDPRNTSRA